ncbi:acyl-CoA dehydrogenase family protein [Nonomuraea soli]|uniref:Alkylation response protein AidB-like acyl-CoA dehydrogenase n=1 Tax=Nonomuraea soli TaxID=1032476 RepID=A0A7W0HMV3_9ACTN|nr:acyl-CoA dehydrogenase family protein [Nonomuraea soli]MBA2888836.1 alkylation response protein AidB-like acyl-CoA dehydrogenase [Nonomuraea soli]
MRDIVRSFLATGPAWPAFAGELGAAGLTVPEQYGGAGCGLEELAVVSAELGRALSPLPFLQTFLAVEAVKQAGDAETLTSLAAGTSSATVLFDGGDHALDGERVFAYRGEWLVEATAFRRMPYDTMDPSRPLARFDIDEARPLGPAGDPERVRDLGVIALAAEQAGGARRCLESAVAYAKTREQFGRPIGSFQAIKHKLADLLMLVESAEAAVAAAVAGAVPAAVAGSYCGEAYLSAAGENIQIHGGIGITWEHDAHRFFKRATSDAQLFGPPQAHRARLHRLVTSSSPPAY